MKKLILFAAVLFANLLAAQSGNSPVAHFPFGFGGDCEATDATQNGSSGVLTNPDPNNPQGCACGVKDLSARFDGVDDGIVFIGTLNEVFSAGDFTVSFYLKPFPQSGTQIVMSKQSDCDRRNAFWVRYNHATRTLSSGISQNDTLLVTVQGKLDVDPCWQFITLTRNFKNYNLYINGTLRDTKTSSQRIDLTSPAPLTIAEKVCDLDKRFKGDIDEVRIYKKALGQPEIDALNLRPDHIANRDTLIYLGNSFQTDITNTCAQSFEWTPASDITDPTAARTTISPTQTTTYYLTFKHAECIARDSVVVTVIDPDTLDCSNIFIPNAFVPGGVNDEFFISNPFAVEEFISFEVFDRWGGRVFDAPTQFATWDGTFGGNGGNPLNPGIYLYRLRYKCNGEEKVKAGSVTLIR